MECLSRTNFFFLVCPISGIAMYKNICSLLLCTFHFMDIFYMGVEVGEILYCGSNRLPHADSPFLSLPLCFPHIHHMSAPLVKLDLPLAWF